jgi:hypothetical protein
MVRQAAPMLSLRKHWCCAAGTSLPISTPTGMIDALSIVQFHDSKLARPNWQFDEPEPLGPGPWCWIHANHRYNTLLFHERDRRRIACYRQRRQYARGAIDAAILACLTLPIPAGRAGGMVDRLSLLSLGIYHAQVHAAGLRLQRARLAARLDLMLSA